MLSGLIYLDKHIFCVLLFDSHHCGRRLYWIMKKKKRTLLWQLELEDHGSVSYLLGTIHAKCDEAFFQINDYCSLIEKTNVFAAEIDLNDMGGTDFIQQALLPDFQTLSSILPPKKYEKLRAIIRKACGQDIVLYDRFLPILLVNLVHENLLPQDQPFALDRFLWNYASRMEKETVGLESIEQQIAVLHKISLEDQIKDLLYLGKHISKERRDLFKMVEIYASGDLQSLYKTAKKHVGGSRKILLYDRNLFMAKRLLEMTKTNSVFCAIGAAHLGGQNGVLRLLKTAGVSVKPIEWRVYQNA